MPNTAPEPVVTPTVSNTFFVCGVEFTDDRVRSFVLREDFTTIELLLFPKAGDLLGKNISLAFANADVPDKSFIVLESSSNTELVRFDVIESVYYEMSLYTGIGLVERLSITVKS